MITVTYKKADGTWAADGSEHLLLDQAKAHAVAAGYPEYKAHKDGMQVAHLFNKDVPQINVPNDYETIVEEEDHEEDDE